MVAAEREAQEAEVVVAGMSVYPSYNARFIFSNI